MRNLKVRQYSDYVGISELATSDPKAMKVARKILQTMERGNRKRLRKLVRTVSKSAGTAGNAADSR